MGNTSAASGATVVRTGSVQCMPSCDHEEVDTIIVVHLKDVPESGCTNTGSVKKPARSYLSKEQNNIPPI